MIVMPRKYKRDAREMKFPGKGLLLRLLAVRYGEKPRDKIDLFITALLRTFPGILRTRHPKMWGKLSRPLSGVFRIKVNGVKYVLRDYVGLLVAINEFEAWMWRYLRLRSGETLIDVGAHIGKYALQAAKVVGERGLVIAVEPDRENFKALVLNAKLNNLKNVIALNIAAWSRDEMLRLFRAGDSGHHSVKYDFGLGFTKVRARPLDRVVEELGAKHIDWIKVDVEGAEYEALLGLKETLKRFKPKVIAEVKEKNLKKVLLLMRNLNYIAVPIKECPEYYYFEPLHWGRTTWSK
jgi:FkbM family methyltransferase